VTAEGALEIRDGKAKIIKEMYCDGLGACIGECPQEALTIVMEEADPFDEEAMEEHLKTLRGKQAQESPPELEAGCPGAKLVHLQSQPSAAPLQEGESSLNPLPHHYRKVRLQFRRCKTGRCKSTCCLHPLLFLMRPSCSLQRIVFLLPWEDFMAELLIAADCVPFAMGGFHSQLLQGKILAIGCPKLDDTGFYIDKLSQIFANNEIKTITIGYMEVPCCAGLLHVVHKALEASGCPR